MARTPLFDRLARVVAIARHCDETGMPTEEGIGEADEWVSRRVSRRDFLSGAAKVAAAGAIAGLAGRPDRAAAAPSSKSRKPVGTARVAVVGAGLAGLACAYELKRAGIPCTVYEASSRLGGRVWSLGGDFSGPVDFPGQVVERGGEFIDTLHVTMRGYARTFGLELEDVNKQPGEVKYYFDGQLHSEAAVVDEFRDFVAQMRPDLRAISNGPTAASHTATDEAFDLMTLSDYLGGRDPGALIEKVIIAAYTGEYGCEPGDLSALAFLLYIHADRRSKFRPFGVFSDERFHVVTGNEGIVEGLKDGFGGPIKIGHRLTAASRSATGEISLTFETSDGAVTGQFDHAVLATPFSALRPPDVDLSGLALPAWKLKAIDELTYGDNAKLMVGFAGRPWVGQGGNGTSYADLAALNVTWETNPTRASATRGVLTDYTGGDLARAIGTLPVSARAAEFLADLDLVFPGAAAAATGDVHLEHWPTNPYTKGAYTCNHPGYFTTIANFEGPPVGNIYFAGEHTSSFYEWQGFMEGAAASGVAAAKAITKAVK